MKQVADFRYVRFHAILHDEVGVYNEDEHGNPVYNFSYVDQIYDGLLKNGVRPFVEISFMPKKLAFNPDALHPFWYKQNVSPPKSMERWDDLMTHFAQHLVDRYGIDEVSQWYFEVWNEPNIDFWNGIPRTAVVFRTLCAYGARLEEGKSAAARGRAGHGSGGMGVRFSEIHGGRTTCRSISSRRTAMRTTPSKIFSERTKIFPWTTACAARSRRCRGEIKSSAMPDLPLFWTEWNVQGMKESRDTIFVGPALANTVRQCDGMVE